MSEDERDLVLELVNPDLASASEPSFFVGGVQQNVRKRLIALGFEEEITDKVVRFCCPDEQQLSEEADFFQSALDLLLLIT